MIQYCPNCMNPIQIAPSFLPPGFFCQCSQQMTFTHRMTTTDADTLLLRAIYAPAEGEYERVAVPQAFQEAFKDGELSV